MSINPVNTSFDTAVALPVAAFATTLAGTSCLAQGTTVLTALGPVAVQNLRPGDMVLTRENGFKPVIDATRAYVSAARQSTDTAFAAITVAAGSLGPDMPARDVTLSAAQPVLVGTDAGETFIKAVNLADSKLKCGNITYVALSFEQTEVIFADGAMVSTN